MVPRIILGFFGGCLTRTNYYFKCNTRLNDLRRKKIGWSYFTSSLFGMRISNGSISYKKVMVGRQTDCCLEVMKYPWRIFVVGKIFRIKNK